ncbi:MAG TPA: transporter substrate-binding domain-containing protein [Spirochaetales bacterium]|nr:transporter substrate-binding domain-containing protein [Spirochaetales bacterium]
MTINMKPFILKFLLLSLAILFCQREMYSQETSITILYYERMPFFGQPYTNDEGFIISIMRLILDDAGIPYTFQKGPLNRLFEYAKKDELVCLPGVFKTPDRELSYTYSKFPIYQDASPRYIIRQSDSLSFQNVHTIKDLLSSKKTLGVIRNYSYGAWVDENVKLYNPPMVITDITDDQSNFTRMLLLKRFDYFFAGGEESIYSIRVNPETKGLTTMMLLDDAPIGNIRWIIFPRTFPEELLEKINSSIEYVKRGVMYNSIIKSIINE